MSSEVCGMIVEHVNLVILICILEEAALPPKHANMRLLLPLGTN